MGDDESWEKEYQNKRIPALRIVGSINHRTSEFPVGKTPRHPLQALMAFYWYERTILVRRANSRSTEPGWVYEHSFGKEEHPGWFADLADWFVEVLPQDNHG